jgi:NADPH-dependent F420 reductase
MPLTLPKHDMCRSPPFAGSTFLVTASVVMSWLDRAGASRHARSVGGQREVIGLIGGTGSLGCGLAVRLAAAGYDVRIGSRAIERAHAAAEAGRARLAGAAASGALSGEENSSVARAAGIVMLTVPYGALESAVAPLASVLGGKIVVDAVVPLRREGEEFDLARPAEGSVSMRLRALLPGARLVAALKTVPAPVLQDLAAPLAGDVPIASDDAEAARAVAELVEHMGGLRPRLVGSLKRADLIEGVTAIALNLNRRYGGHANIQFLGLAR